MLYRIARFTAILPQGGVGIGEGWGSGEDWGGGGEDGGGGDSENNKFPKLQLAYSS